MNKLECSIEFIVVYIFINYFVCRSSKANDVEKIVYGSEVPVLDGEKLSLRSLVCLKVGVFTKCVKVCVLQFQSKCMS